MKVDIKIKSRREARKALSSFEGRDFDYIISISDPGVPPIKNIERAKKGYFSISFLDTKDVSKEHAPRKYHVKKIVSFLRKIEEGSKVLIHCYAGVSRSSATAYILLNLLYGPGKEKEILKHIKKIRPQAKPNLLMIKYADRILNRNGSMWFSLKYMDYL